MKEQTMSVLLPDNHFRNLSQFDSHRRIANP